MSAHSSSSDGQVMELQGLYGPFQFPELLLQKIWAERAFSVADACTVDGQPLKIDTVGRWNRQGGPDFKQARVRVGDEWLHGDVELHLREEDWKAHGHAKDPAYDDVVLHVVLFPSKRANSRGKDGRAIPVLSLLPLLWHDLEEYASDAAVSAIAARPADRVAEAWLELSESERQQQVFAGARRRWEAKVRYARLRVERLGWESACHHTALEILGYRFNRTAMLEVASRWPIDGWCTDETWIEGVFETMKDRWSLQGVRPANHPRRRLAAYSRWCASRRNSAQAWPAVLHELASAWPSAGGNISADDAADVREWRRVAGWSAWRGEVMERIGASVSVPRPRADNVWGDGLLPLLAAAKRADETRLWAWWFMAWPGDQPASLVKAARLIGLADGNRRPLAWGQVQALLGWQHESTTDDARADLRRT